MLNNYLHLYIGCNTTTGRLVGVKKNSCYTESGTGEIRETNFTDPALPVKLVLRRLRDLTEAESSELNRRGINIGRPKGYSFTPDSFLFLLSNGVDLFGLIDRGLAVDQKDL